MCRRGRSPGSAGSHRETPESERLPLDGARLHTTAAGVETPHEPPGQAATLGLGLASRKVAEFKRQT